MFLTTRRLFIIILFAALFLMATHEISDPDFWWHLRTGEFIAQTGIIPHTDIFSFTNAGKEWVTHEWLSEVLTYWIYRTGGFALLMLTFAGIITASFALLYARSAGQPFVAGFIVLWGALATAPTWGVRPQMLSLLLTSVFLFLLDRYQARGKLAFIIPLVPLMLVWVNLHSGFALGLVIISAYLGGLAIEYYLRHTLRANFRALCNLALVLIACALVVLINPNGARMYSYPIETLTSTTMQRYIQEWFSPDFHLNEWQPFALLLIALIAVSSWARVRVSLAWIALVTVFGYAALRSARNIPIFVLIAIPILAQQLAKVFRTNNWQRASSSYAPPRALQILNLLFLVILCGAGTLHVYTVTQNQLQIEQAKFPVAAVNFIQRQRPPSNLYNAYGWGGYLIWRLYPNYRVFIDGRADVYGDQFIEYYLKIYRAEPGWDTELARRDVRLVLIEPDAPLTRALVQNHNWQSVFADTQSVLFERK